MNPIKDTALFKSLLSLYPDQQADMSDVLALALANAAAYTDIRWQNPNPNEAITWRNTPQGSDYWEEKSNKYDEQQRIKLRGY